MRFKFELVTSSTEQTYCYWFIFRKNELLVHLNNNTALIPQLLDINELQLSILREKYFGLFDNHRCYFVEIPIDVEAPKNMMFSNLRSLYGLLDEDLLWVAGRAFQIMNWDRNSKYCGQCGSLTQFKNDELAKICPNCSLINFPRISPAIIVGVLKGNKILLANGTRFQSNLYSVIAGFVSPGESLEECIRREIKEEVGIEIENIRYFGSQSWPFPDSLMIAFLADYSNGEITIDSTEINDARWFCSDDLPSIPGKISIARKIIDWFIENY